MMTSGFFRLLPDLPKIFWRYPISYISFSSWALQVCCNSFHNEASYLTITNIARNNDVGGVQEWFHRPGIRPVTTRGSETNRGWNHYQVLWGDGRSVQVVGFSSSGGHPYMLPPYLLHHSEDEGKGFTIFARNLCKKDTRESW